MQVSIESPTKIQRRMTVVVPVEKMDQVYDAQIAKLSKTVKINGFRPGKVPLNVIKQRFGDSARQEALSELIQSSLYNAMNQEKLSPVGVPRVEPKTILAGQPLEFIATFEVLPVIETINFEVNEIEKQVATITEENVNKVIDHLREQHTTWEKVDRAAQEKDQVIVDFRGTINGKAFSDAEAHDYPIILGSKTMVPGFEEALLGTKKGDEKIIKINFPDNYFVKEVAGKEAEFEITIHNVMQPNLPNLDEVFFKKLNLKNPTLEHLRDEIRKNLERELDYLIKAKLKSQVFGKLLEQNDLEIPKALIENEANRIHDQLHPHHKGRDHGHTEAEMREFMEAAKKNVALGLLIGEFVKQNHLSASKDRIQSFVKNIASAYVNPNEISQWYEKNKRASQEVEMQVLEEIVIEKLLEKVKVTEKVVNYNDLIPNGINQ